VTTSPVEILQPDGRSQSEQAYYALRELIVTLELAPGSLVDERELQERLGLGRTPIREALRALAQAKLIEVYPRRGMFVSGADARDLASLSEVRCVLEPFAAQLAAERRTDGELVELVALLDELDAVSVKPIGRRLIEIDQRIHRFVYHAAHNAFLESVLDEHYMHALRIWFLALDKVHDLEGAVLEHRAILEAIKDGDADRAAVAMKTHVDGFEGSIRRSL
jgi:DNA-binding GntR family transcriptional regulator